MSAISSSTGLTTQAVKQLFGNGSGPHSTERTDKASSAAEKIQDLAAEKADRGKASLTTPSAPGNAPLPADTIQVAGEGEGEGKVDTRSMKERRFPAANFMARILAETSNRLNAVLAAPFTMEPLDEDVPEGAMRAEIDLDEFRQSMIRGYLYTWSSFSGRLHPSRQ